MNQIPSEILEKILGYLPARDRKNVRLVCKSWYDSCNRNEEVVIRNGYAVKEIDNIQNFLRTCGFKRFKLSFQGVDVNKFSATFWNEIGTRISSLEFYKCRLGDETMKSVISSCSNLRHLNLHILLEFRYDAFCSPVILEKLSIDNVINRKLETLKMQISDYEDSSVINEDDDDDRDYLPLQIHLKMAVIKRWKRIFNALYQIFPNLIHFGIGRSKDACQLNPSNIDNMFHFRRMPSKQNKIDEFSLVSIFADVAFAVFSGGNWLELLDSLSSIRLTMVQLHCHSRYSTEDDIYIKNFFKNQRELKSVDLTFPQRKRPRWMSWMKTILFHIAESCPNIHELKLCGFFMGRVNFHISEATELKKLFDKIPMVKYLSIPELVVTCGPSPSTTKVEQKLNSLSLAFYIGVDMWHNLTHLQHLQLDYCADGELQNIFRYCTDLRSLNVGLSHRYTNFGFTGSREGNENSSGNSGYSIRRLQNLEELRIHKITNVDQIQTAFTEFELPKLQILELHSSSPPSPGSFLAKCEFGEVVATQIATKMPSLRKFRGAFTFKTSMTFCRLMKKLHTYSTSVSLINREVSQIFSICPTLRFVILGYNRYTVHWHNVVTEEVSKGLVKF